MSSYPIIHLLPRVQAMAIRAKQPKIALVRGPVFQAVMPSRCAAMRSRLLRWIDMVNIKNPVVGYPTVDTRTPKFRDESKLPAPDIMPRVLFETMLRPVGCSAGIIAKSMLAGRIATLTSVLPFPPRSKVAGAPAVFTSAVFNAVKVGFKWCRTIAARDCNGALFHLLNIGEKSVNVNLDFIAPAKVKPAPDAGLGLL